MSAVRVVALLAVVAALLLPLGYVFSQFWSSTSGDADRAGLEHHGVTYVQPLTALLAGLVSAESATIRGTAVDAATVRSAVAAVDAVDREQGAALHTQDRWNALRPRAIALVEQARPADRTTYTAYAETIDLLLELVGRVGDSSRLVVDPDLDSYYLVDTAVIELPAMLVNAGRAADLAQLGRLEQSSGTGNSGTGQPNTSVTSNTATQAAFQVALARDRVTTAQQAISTDLQKSLASTSSSTLAPNVIGQLDAFLAAAGGLAPATALIGQQDLRPDPAVIGPARDRLQQAATQLQVSSLGELEALLRARIERADVARTLALVAVAISALVAAGLLWFRPELLRRSTGGHDEPDLVDGQNPEGGRSVGVAPELVDARTLLDAGELVRIGRAVRPTRQEHTDDPG